MNRIMVTGVAISFLFFFSGCATIMSHGTQTLRIQSEPEGAVCEITDTTESKSIAKATTPAPRTTEPICPSGILPTTWSSF